VGTFTTGVVRLVGTFRHVRSPATGAVSERERRKERVDSNRIPSLSNARSVWDPRCGICSCAHLDLHAWHGLDQRSRTACTRARKPACQAVLRDRNAANPLVVGAGPPSWIWRPPIPRVFLGTSRHSIHNLTPSTHRRAEPRILHAPMISAACEDRLALACDKSVTRVHTPARGGRNRPSHLRQGLKTLIRSAAVRPAPPARAAPRAAHLAGPRPQRTRSPPGDSTVDRTLLSTEKSPCSCALLHLSTVLNPLWMPPL
jgi:hypothetical protein